MNKDPSVSVLTNMVGNEMNECCVEKNIVSQKCFKREAILLYSKSGAFKCLLKEYILNLECNLSFCLIYLNIFFILIMWGRIVLNHRKQFSRKYFSRRASSPNLVGFRELKNDWPWGTLRDKYFKEPPLLNTLYIGVLGISFDPQVWALLFSFYRWGNLTFKRLSNSFKFM